MGKNIRSDKVLKGILLAIISALICNIFISSYILGGLFILAGSFFIIIGYESDVVVAITSSLTFFLVASLLKDSITALSLLFILSSYLIVGLLLKKNSKHNFHFFIGFGVVALTIMVSIYMVTENQLLDLNKAFLFIRDSMVEGSKVSAVKLTTKEIDLALKRIKEFFPSLIITYAMLATILNLSIASNYIKKEKPDFIKKSFELFYAPFGIFVPVVILIVLTSMDTSFSHYVTLISDNLAFMLEMILSLQGLAICFFLMRKLSPFAKTPLKVLAVFMFMSLPTVFSIVGVADMIFNIRSIPSR